MRMSAWLVVQRIELCRRSCVFRNAADARNRETFLDIQKQERETAKKVGKLTGPSGWIEVIAMQGAS